jgi:predicted aldo/keto reductase-like oxidoreductase
MDGAHAEVAGALKKMHDKGRGILGMKIFGEGAFKERSQRLASIRYVLGLGSVDAFTIGMTSIDQVDENLALIEEAQAS